MSPEETLSQPDVSGTPGALGVPTASGIECPACGTQNTSDSKFCRHCGHLLRSLASGAPVDPKKPSVTEYDDSDEDLTSPAKIDERRAHGLLDRALVLSERGDLAAAILACRQAIALDHNHPDPYSLLGSLLERNGDLRGAMGAYERVLELSPNNELDRDSFNRIKARLEKAPAFNLNQDELFPSNDTLPTIAAGAGAAAIASEIASSSEEVPLGIDARLPPTSASLQTAEDVVPIAETPSEPVTFDFPEAPVDATPSVSPLATTLDGEAVSRVGMPTPPSPIPVPADAVPRIERRERQRRQLNLPVAVDRRTLPDRRASATTATNKSNSFSPLLWPASTPATALTPTQPVAPLDFSFSDQTAARPPVWAQMLRNQSFFMRTLPLIAIGVLGLGFLGWARSQAVSNTTLNATGNPTLVASNTDDGNTDTVMQPSANVPQQQPNTVTGASVLPTPSAGGLAISNATPVPNTPSSTGSVSNNQSPASAPSAPASSNTTSSSPARNTGRTNGGSPSFPRPLPPAAVPPASVPSASSGASSGSNGGSSLVLPPPQTGTGEQQPRFQVSPLGSRPLTPGGSPQEGRIRITQGSLGAGRTSYVPPPPRTGTVARDNERSAASSAAAGNQDQTINNLTNAINASGGDQGYLLQQRAMAFMDRGDYSRAIDDFQSAISAYQNQLDNNPNDASAQAGIRSSRSGLNLALSRR